MFFCQAIAIVVLVSVVVVHGQQYKFTNCGPASDKVKLNSLVITPHPIKIPGPATFTFGVNVIEDMVHPIKTVYDIKATALGITLPIKCENGVGSCTYTDWCTACPTCPCPVVSGAQTMTVPMNITASIPIGSSATMRAKLTMESATGQKACIEITNVSVRK